MTLQKSFIAGALFGAIFFFNSLVADAAWDHCKYTRDIERIVNLEGIQSLNVVAGAGSLEISGNDRSDIKIKARLCSEDEEILQQLNISDEQFANEITIETVFPKQSMWGNSKQSTIDLELSIPQQLMLNVKDSSGAAKIANAAALEIRDSSGELIIKNIAGDVIAFDSSGALLVENVNGNVTITDSSGKIEVDSVKQDVVIEVDSSGAIETTNVKGNVLIKVDSSGSITADNVGGNFTVGKDSSGGIHHSNIKGKISLPE